MRSVPTPESITSPTRHPPGGAYSHLANATMNVVNMDILSVANT